MSIMGARRGLAVGFACAVIGAGSLVRADQAAAPANDRAAAVLKDLQTALGGEEKLAAVKSLKVEGAYRRAMGSRDMEGMLTLTIVRPDKLHRSEEISMSGMVGGPLIERVSVLNGDTAWDDSVDRGGMGGGMRIVMRDGPGPGPAPGGPGGTAGAGSTLTPEQMNEARVRRMRVQLQRWLIALVADHGLGFVDGGVAESPDGKADILEAKEDSGRTLRLFVDQESRRPLMVQYEDPRPMVMMIGGPGGGPGRGSGGPPPSPEEMQKRAEEMRRQGPQMGTYTMHLGEYKKVGGVMLPHSIRISIDGEPNEEWTIEKIDVNPNVKTSLFEKK
jgi:hypothetical protein